MDTLINNVCSANSLLRLFLGIALSLVPAGHRLQSAEPALVKDVNTVVPGSMFLPAGQNIEAPVEMGGYLYFFANDGYHGRELWRTDGTVEGTTLVRDVNPGKADATEYIPRSYLTRVGETLFFRASDGVSGSELWKSDGTAEGTSMVRDVEPGSDRLDPFDLFGANGLLYFYGYGDSGNSGLWRSKGTHEETFRLADFRANKILAAAGRVFFSNSNQLWMTDGTVEGTLLLRTLLGYIRNLSTAGDVLFFTVERTSAVELWKSDGTEGGTALVKVLGATLRDSVPLYFTGMNGVLFFRGWHDEQGALWRSDGTAEGTFRVKEIPGTTSGPIASMGNHLYFAGEGGLWRSDGTEEGTFLVHPLLPHALTVVEPHLYFVGHSGSLRQLWKTDGSSEGTTLLRTFPTGKATPNPAAFTKASEKLFFSADDGQKGRELWTSDGTEEGTVQVTYINSSTAGSQPTGFFEFGNAVYFRANDGRSPWPNLPQLWKSDGTGEGTEKISPDWHAVYSHAVVGDTIFFAPRYTLWKSDGTREGTELIMEISASSSGQIQHLTAVEDLLFFSGNDSIHGAELWRSDGTEIGTVMVKDIRPGGFHSYPSSLTNVGGQLLFAADDGVHGLELWKSDGTDEGTMMVKDISPGEGYGGAPAHSLPSEITAFAGAAFFAATSSGSGNELWTSDGTEDGTVMVIDLEPGPESSAPRRLTVAGDFLFLTAMGGLWRTDGSAGGTHLLKTIDAENLAAAGGRLFFTASPMEDGFELWTSDGTEEGTVLATTIHGLYDPTALKSVGRELWISASQATVGSEVFKISLDEHIPPTIVFNPPHRFAQTGESLTLFVEALGEDLHYQWLHNGSPIAGADSATLVLDSLDASSGGEYTVRVGNAAGETLASLRVTIDPQPPGLVIGEAESGKFRFQYETTAPGLYRVQFSDDLTDWTTATESRFDESGVEVDFIDQPPTDSAARFYRLLVLP